MSDELDAGARAVLASCREADALPDRVRVRVLERVQRDIAAPTVVAIQWWKPGLAALALAAGVAAVWFGSDALRATPRVADGAVPYEASAQTTIERAEAEPVPEPAAIPAAPAVIPEVVPAAAPAELPATDAELEPVPPPSAETARPRPPSRRADAPARDDAGEASSVTPAPSPLVDELTRVREAQSALRKTPTRTLAMLDALDRDYPSGVLGQEREAMRVFALCASGDAKAARSRAASFITRHPSSPLLARIRSTCAGEGGEENSQLP